MSSLPLSLALLLLVQTGGDPALAEIDAYLERCVPFGFSGQVVIERDGEVVLDGAYGWADRGAEVRVTPATAIGAASMTKSFTAAAVLLLVQEGRLALRDPAARYVELPEPLAAITIEQLLAHTSGLPYAVTGDDWEVTDPDELLRRLRSARLEAEPGARFAYSNAGYALLARVIEAVSGERYEDFVRERVLEPAGMTRSGFLHGTAPLAGPLSRCSWRLHEWGDPRAWPLDAALRGAGDLFTTAGDLRRWQEALRAGTVLDAETVATYLEPRVAVQERVEYGLGWFHVRTTDGLHRIEHGGDWKRGFNGLARVYPERRIGLFLTCNARLASGTWPRFVLQDRLEDRLLRDRPLPLPPATVAPDAAALERSCGEYGEDPAERVRVVRDVDVLRIEPRGPRAATLLLGTDERVEETVWAAADGVQAFLAAMAADPVAALDERFAGEPAARDLFLARWSHEVARTGPPTETLVLGGVPGPSGTTQIAAELRGPRGTAVALVYWSADAVAGLDLDASFSDLVRRVAPEGPASFVGHDLETGLTFRVAFDVAANGTARGLRLPRMDADAWLTRVEAGSGR